MGAAVANQPLRVLHVDADIVAVDKPPGLLVHPSALDAHERRTALSLVLEQLGAPMWTVHRLDKGTSGVLLFARNLQMARTLGAAFEAGAVGKRYIALVRGWPPAQGEINHPLARDPEQPSTGQPRVAAVTRFKRLRRIEWPFSDGRHPTSRYAVLDIVPLSGRRHQIRRHLKHIAHPIVGDSTHGKGAHNRTVASWLGLDRLWLHALSLELPALDARPTLKIEAPLEAAWRRLLEQPD